MASTVEHIDASDAVVAVERTLEQAVAVTAGSALSDGAVHAGEVSAPVSPAPNTAGTHAVTPPNTAHTADLHVNHPIVGDVEVGETDTVGSVVRLRGVPLPSVEVRYRNISYSVNLSQQQAQDSIPNVFATIWRTVKAPVTLIAAAVRSLTPNSAPDKSAADPQKPQQHSNRVLHVLKDVSGVIRPGTLTLVLSPPGHGKSAFLKAITNQLPKKGHTGEISYSGLRPDDATLHLGQLVQYVSQLDEHLPHLTVHETLSFVYDNATVNPATCGYPHLHEEYENGVEDIINLLHLEHCRNTIIGNDLLRGVSGGEKKRVTVGEGLLTNARCLALDEISTGLDSAVTYKIVKSLRDRAHANGLAVVISLLQPTPEVFALFDEVVLIREGCVLYHGARTSLPTYMASVGFDMPDDDSLTVTSPSHLRGDRKTDAADWLVKFLTHPETMKDVSPTALKTTEELVAAWVASDMFNSQMTAPPAPPIQLEGVFARRQYSRAYAHSFWHHLGLLVKRQFLLMRRNPLYLRARVGTALIMGVILGGLYWQRTTDQGQTYYGTFLNACMNLGFGNLAEMATAVEQKYVAYKHISHGNYPSAAFVASGAIAHLPVSICVGLMYLGILYSMVGLTTGADHFFFFVLVCFLIDVFFRNMMAMFSYAARSLQAAQAAPLPIISLLILFAGFLVTPAKMGWMTFLYYVDIFGYAIRSLAQNEFLSPRYSAVPAGATSTLGELFLSSFGIQTAPEWKWGGIGFQAGSVVIIVIASYFAFISVRFDRSIGSRRVGTPQVPPSKSSVVLDVNGATASDREVGTPSTVAAKAVTSALEFQHMSVAFRDIEYTVRLPKRAGGGTRTLLRGVHGYALPGRITALMGASGAGKTTLLDVLAGRKNSGTLGGQIWLNGHPKDEKTFNRVAAYVEQQDLHLPLTTVREAIDFSARLRLPSSVQKAQRDAHIEEILDLLELRPLQHRLVGAPGTPNSLAPGERKRLTIAVELVSNAPIIFLDEPTSGLDSRAAEVVMRVVRNIANTGRTIICTVHQPSCELFFMFDDLLLLQRGGWQVYLGPIGDEGAQMVEYLSTIPGFDTLPQGMNPSSWMLDKLGELSDAAVSPKAGASQSGGRAMSGDGLQAGLHQSPVWTTAQAVIENLLSSRSESAVSFTSVRARSLVYQYQVLVQRLWTCYYRNVGLNFGRLLALTVLNLMFGTVYYNIAEHADDLAGVQSLIAAVFMTAAFSAMINMNTAVPPALQQRPVVYRELSTYMYHPTIANLASFTVEAPWLAGIILATTPLVYFMMGLSADVHTFFFHYLVVLVLGAVYVSIGAALAATMPTFEVAQACLGILGPLFFLFGGLWSPPSQMAPGARWFCWIDPITYAFRALIPPHFYCEGPQCPTVTIFTTSSVAVVDRYRFVSNKYDVSYADRWENVGYLSIFVIVFQLLSMLATRFVRHQTR